MELRDYIFSEIGSEAHNKEPTDEEQMQFLKDEADRYFGLIEVAGTTEQK